MKTLKELGLENAIASNYAKYNYITHIPPKTYNFVYCGYMEIHEDSDNLGDSKKEVFNVIPLYWEDDGVFCILNRKKWSFLNKIDFLKQKKVCGIKYENNGFSFNATKYHAFAPMRIAEKFNISNFSDSIEYKVFEQRCFEQTVPKLVWTWGHE